MKQYESYKDSGTPWIGPFPSHWEVKPIKFTARIYNGDSLNDSQKSMYMNCDQADSIPYIASKDVDRDTEFVDYENGIRIPLGGKDFSVARAYTTLLCIEGGSAGKKMAFVNQPVCFVNKLCCFDSNLDDKFNYYYVCSNIFKEPFSQNLQGMIGGVTISEIKNFPIIVPPCTEQHAIANYLDKKCGSIDKVIATQERRIVTLGELKQSIITEAVTRGINPNAPLKDSGIDWIGKIPEHWEAIPLKFTGSFGNGLTYHPEEVVESDGILVLRSSNIQEGVLDFEDTVFVNSCPEFLMVRPGDIIICSRNGSASLVGKCAMVEEEINATFGAFMMRYRPYQDPKFGFYLLQVALKKYKGLYSTTTINQLTMGVIAQIHVAIPPIAEQTAIAEYLDRKCARIDSAIAKAKREVELLREFKQSVITEAVTGKIKVC